MGEINEMLETVVEACEDRKAENCVVLNMQHLSPVADFFVICHGDNERQVQAIARTVKNELEANDFRINRIEGFEKARWILIDTGDIVCHVFHKDERSYYNLERLWGDAEEIVVGENK